MADTTGIAWTDTTWNPLRGCSRVSEGCRNCYAEGVAHRFRGPGLPYEGLTTPKGRWTGEVRLAPHKLAEPLRWRKPRRVFVNSMSDIFHEAVPDEYIAAVFGVMSACPQHTFQVLTKRPERALEWYRNVRWLDQRPTAVSTCRHIACRELDELGPNPHWRSLEGTDGAVLPDPPPWPLPNVWLGVSAEDQETADERIPLLLQAPAAVRWVSLEPMLGPVDIGLQAATCECCDRWPSRWVTLRDGVRADAPYLLGQGVASFVPAGIHRAGSNRHGALSVGGIGIQPGEMTVLPGLDWVVVGAESGRNARPCDVEWIRHVLAQCRTASTPAFCKQLGARAHDARNGLAGALLDVPDVAAPLVSRRLKHRAGADPSEWPVDLRVQEWPDRRRNAQ